VDPPDLGREGRSGCDRRWPPHIEQLSKHRKLCFWCLLAALASVAAVPQVLPEARLAWGELRARRER
jgi:hypothetical protein